jgi:hypothetical protein
MGEMMFKTFCEGYKIYTKYLRAFKLIKLATKINLSEASLNEFAANIVINAMVWQSFKNDYKNTARLLEWLVW